MYLAIQKNKHQKNKHFRIVNRRKNRACQVGLQKIRGRFKADFPPDRTGQTGSADTSNRQSDALNRSADAFLHVGHYFLVGMVV